MEAAALGADNQNKFLKVEELIEKYERYLSERYQKLRINVKLMEENSKMEKRINFLRQ